MRFLLASLLFLIVAFGGTQSGFATVRLAGIFGDHMVLQKDTTIPIWGWADAGEKITVKLGEQTATATAGSDGKWRADLPPFSGNAAIPQALKLVGNNTVTVSDVLIGDVWLCSGQSNMEYPLRLAHNAATELPQANDPKIRLFLVTRRPALHPLDDLSRPAFDYYAGKNGFALSLEDDTKGVWMVCSPEKASEFSAVGYFFAKELRANLKRPIGIIGSYRGGSPGDAWLSLAGLQADPNLSGILADYKQKIAPFASGPADMDALQATYVEAQKKWTQDLAADPGFAAYQSALSAWRTSTAEQRANHQPTSPAPVPPIAPPHAPPSIVGATVLYNGMIAPLMPFAIKGVVWYQGEENSRTPDTGLQYRSILSHLITDWREKWGEGNFPFLIVQLPGNGARPKTPVGELPHSSAWVREAQLKALSLPNTGVAVAIDLGSTTTIHPPDKQAVGHRLALVAERVAYGQTVVDSGPMYDSMKVDGNKIRVSFTHVEDGLKIGATPWIDPAAPPLSTTDLKGFAIAGADKNWVWAHAKIDGNDVVISSDQVPNPVAVRYGWSENPECNLYNTADLPASPFRTDDWKP